MDCYSLKAIYFEVTCLAPPQTAPNVIAFLVDMQSKRAELNSQIKPLQSILDEKRKEIESLQQALAKLRTTNNAGRGGLCSSEEELKNIIYILREIKQLEGTRDKIIANAALRAEVQNFVWKKEAIQDQVELVSGELNGMKKDRQAVRSKIKKLDDALKAIDNDILSLEEEKVTVTQKREKAFESIQHLRRKRDEGNASFYQSRRIMTKAKDLAAEKDINALQELSHKEVEKFMSHWNSDRTFRDNYVKRLLQSLDIRQLSRDGRMRNPDEKPLMEEPKPNENNTSPNRSVKQGKEEALLAQKVQKVTKNKGRYLKSKLDNENLEDTDEYEFENSHKETSVVETAVDPEKLKEIKRVEEIAKAKRALERKKKLAEKAVAKAAKKAQMEAVKKLKGRDKKAKKETDEVVEATEKENVNDNVIEDSAPVKEKVQKESRTKYAGRSKCPEAIPKVIIKRKKSKNLWISFTIFACLVMVMSMLALHSLSLDI
ncbi:putative proton pump-interactor [Lupinus albus]|uniref:Putative proton pump-interactor n=1 Tax=Lupinus albus TaxID=3870 RepID=A0A6A4QUA0_LUPAL|nr:putative proton pump-interactor [Lupinus albus]